MPVRDLVLVAAFVNSANVGGLRVALQLPTDLGKLEAAVVRSAALVFARLRKTASAPTDNFARDCRKTIDGALLADRSLRPPAIQR